MDISLIQIPISQNVYWFTCHFNNNDYIFIYNKNIECDHTKCATCEGSTTNCLIYCKEGCIFCDALNKCSTVKDGYFIDPIT